MEEEQKTTETEKQMSEEQQEMSELEQEMSELEQENERLRKENELLKEYRASLPLKERLYDRIPLTVKQLDAIIVILLAFLVGVVTLGILDR